MFEFNIRKGRMWKIRIFYILSIEDFSNRRLVQGCLGNEVFIYYGAEGHWTSRVHTTQGADPAIRGRDVGWLRGRHQQNHRAGNWILMSRDLLFYIPCHVKRNTGRVKYNSHLNPGK